jgi:quinol monooxygenase YgiN
MNPTSNFTQNNILIVLLGYWQKKSLNTLYNVVISMKNKRLTIITIIPVIALVIYGGNIFAPNAFATNTSATPTTPGINQQNISGVSNETSHVRVLVSFEIKEGNTQEFLNNAVPNLDSARSEEGNISFELLQSTQNPNEFLIDQHWSSKAAYDKHHNSTLSVSMNEIINNLAVKPQVFKEYTEVNAIHNND